MNTSFLLGGDLPVHRIGYGAMRLTGQPGGLLVVDNTEGHLAVIKNWPDYDRIWTRFMKPFRGWRIQPVGDAFIVVRGRWSASWRSPAN